MTQKQRHATIIRLNRERLANNLGMHLRHVPDQDNPDDEHAGEFLLEVEMGDEPILADGFKEHITNELGAHAHDEMQEKAFEAYVGVALGRAAV